MTLLAHITQVRPRRSLTARMQVINAAINKLRGCIRQIENLNSSGVSQQDILNQAKVLLAQDPNYSKGFKFDHVWLFLKDTEKYFDFNSMQTPGRRKRHNCIEASQSDSTMLKFAEVSSLYIDLNADFKIEEQVNDINDNNDSIERLVGRNKEKK